MRKTIFTFLVIIFTVSIGYSQVTTLWEKKGVDLPAWFTASNNNVRGMAYHNDTLFFVQRNVAPTNIRMVNATTGADIDSIPNGAGIVAGGTFLLSEVEVASNGKVFASNLVAAAGTDNFFIYRWDSKTAPPVKAITFSSVARMGDYMTLVDNGSNNIEIYAPVALSNKFVIFKSTDGGLTFPTVVVDSLYLADGITPSPVGNGPCITVAGVNATELWVKSGGQNIKRYMKDAGVWKFQDEIPGGIVSTSNLSLKYLQKNANKYLMTVGFGTDANANKGRLARITDGLTTATVYAETPQLGTYSNAANGSDNAFKQNVDGTTTVFVLSTGNGFGAYQVDLRPQLSGDFYVGAAGTGLGGTDPDFPNLRDAYQTINNSNITGDCNFFITSDITEITTPGGLGLAVNPEPYTITFKPHTGVQPVITLPYTTDGNSGPSGAMVIGIPMDNNIAWNDLRTTKNIVFDGSNTVGGTTRDLTFTSQTNSVGNAFPMTIVGDVSNMVIKNCNIYYRSQTTSTSNLFRAAVQIRARLQLSLNWTPSNITLENNHISANFTGVSQGALGVVTVSLSPQPTNQIDGLVIKNNLIEGKQRVVGLGWSASTDVYDNELIMNQDISATVVNTVIVAANIVPGSEVNIYNNIISSVSSMANAAAAGNTAISIESAGTYNVYNNMISGFNLMAANPTAFLRGISVTSATATANLNYNTIYMTNIADIGTGAIAYSGIFMNNGTNDLNNNIVVSAETDFVTYCINRTGTAGTVTSNYNNFYPVSATNGNVGFWDAAATPTLANWQTASGQDANSKSKEVFFVSTTDLHLTGSSVGDFDLAGTPIPGITTDIDGDTRSTTYPYKGADEGNVPLTEPLPDILLVENFEYGAVDDTSLVTLTSNWIRHSGVMGPAYSATSLLYSGYASSGIGGAVTFTNGGSANNDGDINRIFTNVTQTQDVYASFLLNLSSARATADYFFHLGPDPISTTFRGRFYARSLGAGWVAGLSKSGSTGTIILDTLNVLNLNQTYLVVVKYQFSPNAVDDDLVTLYIYESGLPAIEPGSPVVYIGPLGAGVGSDPNNIGSVAIRQGTNSPTGKIDGIRIATTWAEVVIPVELTTFIASTNGNNVILNWSTATETNNQGFEVERSSDGEFVKVGFVPGFGTTTEVRQYSFADNNLTAGTYSYRLRQIDFDGTFEYSKVVEVEVLTPKVFDLSQNYPNPFNPTTKINYSVPFDSRVTISVYSITGELVMELVNDNVSAGSYSIDFDGRNLASGMYIYRMTAGNFTQTNKMMLMK